MAREVARVLDVPVDAAVFGSDEAAVLGQNFVAHSLARFVPLPFDANLRSISARITSTSFSVGDASPTEKEVDVMRALIERKLASKGRGTKRARE